MAGGTSGPARFGIDRLSGARNSGLGDMPMKFDSREGLKKLWAALEIPAPDPEQLFHRIEVMERDVALPVKAVCIGILLLSFFFTPWVGSVNDALTVALEFSEYFFWFYLAANVVFAVILMNMRRLPLALIQWGVFVTSLTDGLLLAVLTLMTGGYDSILFWLFVVLIMRNAVSVPPTVSQIALNLATVGCYVLAGVIDIAVAENLNLPTRQVLGLDAGENAAEPLLLRLFVLVLMGACCYGVQILLERQRLTSEEAREFAVREGQLHSAGRMAAEFAHQIKNPLAIINNAVFSLQRAWKESRPEAPTQMQIIQEEVARADRIITQVMNYAQLAEGRLEKLNVVEELDRAIEQVFPPAASQGFQIERHFAQHFPPLLMQRQHFSEIVVNVLLNAREAVNGSGSIIVGAFSRTDHTTEISIRDTGSGIAADKRERIFEAYYTTKSQGTGLGLAIVKHNVELYGGAMHVESELGKGTRFVLIFPAKTLLKLTRPI